MQKAPEIENYYGFEKTVSGECLLQAGVNQAKRLGASFADGEVFEISPIDGEAGGFFEIGADCGSFKARAIILATGAVRFAPSIKDLESYEGRGVSYCSTCDAFFYRGKSVAVLGSGKYAQNEAKTLARVAGGVAVLTNGKKPEAAFPDGFKIIDKKITALKGSERLEGVVFADGDELELSGLFVAEGVAGSAELAKKIGAYVDGDGIAVDGSMQTSVKGLFAAGDCTGGMRQIVKAAYEGALAGTQAVKYVNENYGR